MKKPVLVIMAAGIGSRYGGLKQLDPVDDDGSIIMDYSVFDAARAGFEKVVFVIKKENDSMFRELIGSRIPGSIETDYVYQELDNIPEGKSVPEGRVKPWGTGHAVLSCMGKVDGPFAVINADDYYGPEAFKLVYDYITTHDDDEKFRYVMAGFKLGNTLTENGHVSRGVCSVASDGSLSSICERTYIVKTEDGAAFSEDDGKTFTSISADETVSMNMWGFGSSVLGELNSRFENFMKEQLPSNPLKAEYFLPSVVSQLIEEGKASVEVLQSHDKWYGMTYKEDKPMVEAALKSLRQSGTYPMHLWK